MNHAAMFTYPRDDFLDHGPRIEILAIDQCWDRRIGDLIYRLPYRHRLEWARPGFLVVLSRMTQIWLAVLIDRDVEIYASIFGNGLREHFLGDSPGMKQDWRAA